MRRFLSHVLILRDNSFGISSVEERVVCFCEGFFYFSRVEFNDFRR